MERFGNLLVLLISALAITVIADNYAPSFHGSLPGIHKETVEGIIVLNHDQFRHGGPRGIHLHDQPFDYGTGIDGLLLALNPKVESKLAPAIGKPSIDQTGPTVHVKDQTVAIIPDKQVLLELYLDGKHAYGHMNPRLNTFFIHSAPIYNHKYHPVHVHSKVGPVFVPYQHHGFIGPNFPSLHAPALTLADDAYGPFPSAFPGPVFDHIETAVLLNGPAVVKVPELVTGQGVGQVAVKTKTVLSVPAVKKTKDFATLGVAYNAPPIYKSTPVYTDHGPKDDKHLYKHNELHIVVPPFFYFLSGGICP